MDTLVDRQVEMEEIRYGAGVGSLGMITVVIVIAISTEQIAYRGGAGERERDREPGECERVSEK